MPVCDSARVVATGRVFENPHLLFIEWLAPSVPN